MMKIRDGGDKMRYKLPLTQKEPTEVSLNFGQRNFSEICKYRKLLPIKELRS